MGAGHRDLRWTIVAGYEGSASSDADLVVVGSARRALRRGGAADVLAPPLGGVTLEALASVRHTAAREAAAI